MKRTNEEDKDQGEYINGYVTYKEGKLYIKEFFYRESKKFLIEKVLDKLRNTTFLTELDITKSKIDDGAIKNLSEALKPYPFLTKIGFSDNDIGYMGAEALSFNVLASNNFKLNFDREKLGDAVVNYLSQAAGSDNYNLELDSGNIGAAVVRCLRENQAFSFSLSIGNREIGAAVVQYLHSILTESISISEILPDNRDNIGTAVVWRLYPHLPCYSSLKELDLHNNKIGDRGVGYLSHVLKFNTSLAVLNLSSNEIGNEGAKYLSYILKSNTSLTELDLSGNKIGDEGTQFLLQAMVVNKSLTELNLTSNGNISNKISPYIAEVLQSNSTRQIKLDNPDSLLESILPFADHNSIISQNDKPEVLGGSSDNADND